MQKTTLRAVALPSIAVLAVVALAGCTRYQAPQTTTPQTTGQTSTNVNGTIPSFNITGGDDNSTVTFGGGELPAGWPTNRLPVPSNAQVVFSGTEATEDGNSFSASLVTNQSPEAAYAELKSSYAAAGWSIEGEYSGTFGVSSAGFSGTMGNDEVTIVILSDPSEPGQTSITISASIE